MQCMSGNKCPLSLLRKVELGGIDVWNGVGVEFPRNQHTCLNPFSNHSGICVSFELVASCAALTAVLFATAVVAMCAVAVRDCVCEMLLLFTYIV